MGPSSAVVKWLRQAVGLAVAIPATIVGIALVTPAAPAAAAPFGCTSNFYYSGGNAIRALLPDGTEQVTSTAPFNSNTIALTSSGEMYSLTPAAGLVNHLFSIAADGTATDLGTVAGLPAVNSVGAGFTDSGELLATSGTGRVYRIDVGALTATEVTTANTAVRGDLVSVGGQIYSAGTNATAIQRIDLATGVVTAIPVSNATSNPFAYPALWSVGGHLYGSVATTVYEILDFETGTARRVQVATLATPQPTAHPASPPLIRS